MVKLDPERGRAAAAKLKALGVKGVLIQAAEQGYITQLACKMPECFCPEELGGACYFEPVTAELSDWMPTHEHFPLSKKDGGHRTVDNAILAHRLCNRIDYSIRVGRSYARDLERIRKAREEATRRLGLRLGLLERLAGLVDRLDGGLATATAKPKKEPEFKSLPDAAKAQYLLDHPTISDRSWTNEPRLKGEKRDAFIRRNLLATPKPKKTSKAPAWKSLPDAAKAQYLLEHATISDRSWTNEPRLKGEKRDAFIRRKLLG